jgi:prefoldin subunit 2
VEVIKDLEPNRKCWRLVGGALVEKSVGEVLPSL